MTDLTKNKEAFGLMDKADQEALLALPNDQVEVLGSDGWIQKTTDICFGCLTYRQKPQPPKPVVETQRGECWAEALHGAAPVLWDEDDGDVKSTYTQTTINGKFARCVITAEGYTPTLTDEQAREVVKILTTLERIEVSKADIAWANRLFTAFVKVGVV